MIKKSSIFCFFILGFVLLCSAQEEKSASWNGNLGLGLSLTRGNTETTNFSFTYLIKKSLSPKIEFSSTGSYLLGRIEGTTKSQSLGLAGRLNWEHTERFFTFFEAQGIRDRFKNYDYRIFPTAGAGVKVLLYDKAELSATAGLSEVFTKYYDTGDTDSYTGVVLGNTLTWKLSPTAELTQKMSLNSNISELSHYFIQFEISLSAAITESWALKVSFIDNYDSNPIGEGIKKNDIVFLANVTLKFGD
jgi:putative salt-induced outer membrane protein YdiY